MRRMIADAKGCLDDGGDALGRPERAQAAKRLRPTGEQRGDLLPLRCTQLRSPPRMGFAPHGGASATIARPLQPLTHRPGRHAQRGGTILLFPALLREVNGTQPPAVDPVTRSCSG